MTFVENCMRAPIRERHRREREERQARIQRGECAGARPMATLAEMSPEKRARVIAETMANHAPRWTPPNPDPSTLVRVVDVEPVLAGPRRYPKDSPMTNLETARSLRAELESLTQQQNEKQREALRIADELEEEAAALRVAAGGVAITVKTETPPKAMSVAQVRPTNKSTKRGGNQPHAGKVRPGTLNARIVALLTESTFGGKPFLAREIATRLSELGRAKVVAAACVKLAKQGHIKRVGPGLYRRAS